jgi:hypothetical protein
VEAEWRERASFDEVAEALGVPVDQVVGVIRHPGYVFAFYDQEGSTKTWLVRLVREDDGALAVNGEPHETDFLRLLGDGSN